MNNNILQSRYLPSLNFLNPDSLIQPFISSNQTFVSEDQPPKPEINVSQSSRILPKKKEKVRQLLNPPTIYEDKPGKKKIISRSPGFQNSDLLDQGYTTPVEDEADPDIKYIETVEPKNHLKIETNTPNVAQINSGNIHFPAFDDSQFYTKMLENVPKNQVVEPSIPTAPVPHLYTTMSSHQQPDNGLYTQNVNSPPMAINFITTQPTYKEIPIQQVSSSTAIPPHYWVFRNNSPPSQIAAIQQSHHNIHHHPHHNTQPQIFRTGQPQIQQPLSFVQHFQSMFRTTPAQPTQTPIYYPPPSIQSYTAPVQSNIFQPVQQPLPTFPTFPPPPPPNMNLVQPTTFAPTQYLTPQIRSPFQYQIYANNTTPIHHRFPVEGRQQTFC